MTNRFKKRVLGTALLATCSAMGNMTLFENVTLDADTDWRNQGTVTIGNAGFGHGRTVDASGRNREDVVQRRGGCRMALGIVQVRRCLAQSAGR